MKRINYMYINGETHLHPTCSTRNDWVPKLKLPIIPSVNSFDMAPTTEVMRFYLFRFLGFSRVCKFIFIGSAFKSSLHTNTTAFLIILFQIFSLYDEEKYSNACCHASLINV